MNSRLDELQAGILRAKLLCTWRDRTGVAQAVAALRRGSLRRPLRRAGATAGAEHVFHQYVIRALDRSLFRQRLLEEGLAPDIHYPVPIHQQRAYAGRVLTRAIRLPVDGNHRQDEIVGMPIFPGLTDAQVDHVCSALHRWSRC